VHVPLIKRGAPSRCVILKTVSRDCLNLHNIILSWLDNFEGDPRACQGIDVVVPTCGLCTRRLLLCCRSSSYCRKSYDCPLLLATRSLLCARTQAFYVPPRRQLIQRVPSAEATSLVAEPSVILFTGSTHERDSRASAPNV
jgi:hypothetical protein